MHITLNDIKNEVKWFFQRVTRGYDDRAMWDLGGYILNHAYKPFKAFVKKYEEEGLSLPHDFVTDPAAWLLVLQKIEFSFDYYWNSLHDDCSFDEYKQKTKEEIHEENKKVQEGMELFGKYMMDLWD